MTRYHLWFVRPSRGGPHGARGSGAVTGAVRPVPYCAGRRFRRLLQGVFTRTSLPRSTHPGALCAETAALLFLFLAVVTLYHTFLPLSTVKSYRSSLFLL